MNKKRQGPPESIAVKRAYEFSREAEIIINGVALTQAEAMTMRIALGLFYMRTRENIALGDTVTGQHIQMANLECCQAINRAMSKHRAGE